jgi:uncharacterized Zn-binding protein involved in type VI secretion
MPAVCVKGDSLTTGHDCVATTTLDTPPQSSVTIGGELVAIVGTPTVEHDFPPACEPHVAYVNAGSSKVSIGGIPIARVGDSADAGVMTSGQGGITAGG